MPKISPRESVREHPLYRSAMAAQHAAYQLMRDVPASAKADATRLHAALVHATTWATALLDDDVAEKDRTAARKGFEASVASASEMLGPLAPLADDAGIVDTLEKRMEELRKVQIEAKSEPAAAPQAEPAA
ncbi:MAG TPA: hypothetical protein PLB01_15640 [Thermoanaerobaculia bacterium]|nr:hypothetical protein [Thermoanaerobaculia bacterium]